MNFIKKRFSCFFLIALGMFLLGTATISCKKLRVDDYFDETLAYDSVFHNKLNVERYLWASAAYFPEEGNIFGNNYTPGPMACDEGFTLFSESEFRGIAYSLGYVTPTNLYGMDTWAKMYNIIRRANTIVSRINEAADMTALDRRQILGYTYFMRAYAYYHLAVKYGPVVLVGDDPMNNNEPSSYYERSRATMDETFDYICTELEKAALLMPGPEAVAVSNFGRPSSGAAYGLVARLRLIQASPLFNPKPGNSAAVTYFGSWKRKSDGVNYVSQVYDERKWAVAAMAAKRVIDMGTYALYTVERMPDSPVLPAGVSNAAFPNGAGDIDPFHSYSDMFTGEGVSARNPEFIWACASSNMQNYTRHAFPTGVFGGWNGLCVTQKVIDAYRMADGRDIKNSSTAYPYSITGTLGVNKTFSGYQLRSTVRNMYVNREMRFYASIGFSQRYWTASSTTETARKNIVISYENLGNAGKNQSGTGGTDYPVTGYVMTKFVHPDDAWAGAGAQRLSKTFPIIRYAEILLSYAEALNNLTVPYTIEDQGETYNISRDLNEISKNFNQVRYRAGLPGLNTTELSSAASLQQAVERERMVEFLFENRRYFDVRRWGKYEDTERELITGVNTETSGEGFYSIVPVNHAKARNRMVDKKLVLFPLALDEVRKSPLLDQNPGWQN